MKKTIILYNPKAVFFDMPLALIALGTQVCEDYNVVIIDARIESDVDEILKEYIDQALLVGVTSLTGAPLKDAISFSKKVRFSLILSKSIFLWILSAIVVFRV